MLSAIAGKAFPSAAVTSAAFSLFLVSACENDFIFTGISLLNISQPFYKFNCKIRSPSEILHFSKKHALFFVHFFLSSFYENDFTDNRRKNFFDSPLHFQNPCARMKNGEGGNPGFHLPDHPKCAVVYSTKSAPPTEKRRKFPSDSRCGSVETCRNAAGLLISRRQEHTRKVGALRVESAWQA